MARKFIRFITFETDGVTGYQVGFFKAAYALRRSNHLLGVDKDTYSGILDWFDNELDAPNRLARSANSHAHGKALSWFKPEAEEHIAKARQLLSMMARNSIASKMIKTADPGYVLYEEDYQLIAIPFRDR